MDFQNIKWDEYKWAFPKRYIKASFFDTTVKMYLQRNPVETIVDIGGGHGSTVIERWSDAKIWLLDPHMIHGADWMEGKVEWTTNKYFDLAVVRNSINYFSKAEIELIPKIAKCFFINTFIKPPLAIWKSRTYETINGELGIERFRYNEETEMVEHKLFPSDLDAKPVFHQFHYYTTNQLLNWLGDAETMEYSRNSILIYRIRVQDNFILEKS